MTTASTSTGTYREDVYGCTIPDSQPPGATKTNTQTPIGRPSGATTIAAAAAAAARVADQAAEQAGLQRLQALASSQQATDLRIHASDKAEEDMANAHAIANAAAENAEVQRKNTQARPHQCRRR